MSNRVVNVPATPARFTEKEEIWPRSHPSSVTVDEMTSGTRSM